ncbi:MAG TPA: N-acetyltransferase [Anaerolineales bacterium]|nr:N-acetyltransferase [Anaerolineales bacterium]
MLLIRPETTADISAIHQVNKQAFDGRDAEPGLVAAIRGSRSFIPELSLVAQENKRIVGHILFSRIHIASGEKEIPALALAPMAVLPEYQKRGIGSTLVKRGLEECRRLDHAIVIVLGHPTYYPRFGFSSQLAEPLDCPYGNCGDAWMALELVHGALNGIQGKVIYPSAFHGV